MPEKKIYFNIKMIISIYLLISLVINNNPYASKITLEKNIFFVGGTGEGNYSNIQEAIDNASKNDIIYVFSGLYKEHIIINKSLIIIGEDKNNTIIDGCENDYVINLFANDTRISNFNIQNSSENGLNVDGSRNLIENNIFQKNGYLGISIKNSYDTNLFNNIIRQNERGICLCLCCFNTVIMNNSFENNNFCGLYIYKSCDNYIFRNHFQQNKCGSIISLSHNNTLYLNNICNCKRCGLNLYRSFNNTIKRNNFIKSSFCAFFTCCNNNWDGNYWNRARLLPKFIIGLKEKKIIFPTLEFDRNPSKVICC